MRLRPLTLLVPLLLLVACDSNSGAPVNAPPSPVTSEPVPVNKEVDLVDAAGSILGTVTFLQSATSPGTEIEVKASGLSAGSHPMTLNDVGDCSATDDTFDAVGEPLPDVELSAVVVADNGVGDATAQVPPNLEQLLDDDGTALVIGPTESPATGDGPTGSDQACAAVPQS